MEWASGHVWPERGTWGLGLWSRVVSLRYTPLTPIQALACPAPLLPVCVQYPL